MCWWNRSVSSHTHLCVLFPHNKIVLNSLPTGPSQQLIKQKAGRLFSSVMPAPLLHDHTPSVFPVFPLLTFIINWDLKSSEAWFVTGNGVRGAQRERQRAAEEMLQTETWRASCWQPGRLLCCSAGSQVKSKHLISPFWLGETLEHFRRWKYQVLLHYLKNTLSAF